MNKIKNVYIVWGVIVVLIFILLTVFGFLYKNKTNVYKNLEEKLVEAEKKYADAKFLYPQNGETVKVTAEEMIEYGALDSLEHDGENCNGYAIIQKKVQYLTIRDTYLVRIIKQKGMRIKV